MSSLQDFIPGLDKIKPYKLFAYILTFSALVVPGIGYIYISQNPLFLRGNSFQLIALSLFLSLPLILIGIIQLTLYLQTPPNVPPKITNSNREDFVLEVLLRVSFGTLGLFYISIFAFLLFRELLGKNWNLFYFMYIIPMLDLLVDAIIYNCKKSKYKDI